MARQIEPSRSRPPIMRRAVAALILVAVAVLVFHIVAGLIVTVFWIVAVIAVIAAVVWAARELF
jgi:predicted anti-sigma-YlaC factor YlaD